jgi:hypothetical protein
MSKQRRVDREMDRFERMARRAARATRRGIYEQRAADSVKEEEETPCPDLGQYDLWEDFMEEFMEDEES